jgi:hypothetical protein
MRLALNIAVAADALCSDQGGLAGIASGAVSRVASSLPGASDI